MTPPIERIRFYDGEYLRAFDFAAEQGYHIDMRRRLNMALHLNGVGVGLQLVGSPSGAVVSQVYITPGMGIDEYGREVYLAAPYTFDDQADVVANRISAKGYYYVWLKYQRVADTPPSAGYAVCNGAGQTTRWRESYKVVLQHTDAPTNPPSSASPPAVTDDISEEDPDTDASAGIFLGVVFVDPGSNTGVFTLPASQPPLTYVGLRAQRIISPQPVDATAWNLLNQQSALNPPASLELDDNVFAKQNLIVGEDFVVTQKPANPTGNVKITGDLYLNGSLYTNSTGNAGLQQLVQSMLPDIQFIPVTINLPASPPNPVSQAVTATSTLTKCSKAVAQAVLCGVQWSQQSAVQSWFSNLPVNALPLVQVSASPATTPLNGATSCTIQINWKAEPWVTTGGNNFNAISALLVGLIVVFYP
jgi:hypothetical protein